MTPFILGPSSPPRGDPPPPLARPQICPPARALRVVRRGSHQPPATCCTLAPTPRSALPTRARPRSAPDRQGAHVHPRLCVLALVCLRQRVHHDQVVDGLGKDRRPPHHVRLRVLVVLDRRPRPVRDALQRHVGLLAPPDFLERRPGHLVGEHPGHPLGARRQLRLDDLATVPPQRRHCLAPPVLGLGRLLGRRVHVLKRQRRDHRAAANLDADRLEAHIRRHPGNVAEGAGGAVGALRHARPRLALAVRRAGLVATRPRHAPGDGKHLRRDDAAVGELAALVLGRQHRVDGHRGGLALGRRRGLGRRRPPCGRRLRRRQRHGRAALLAARARGSRPHCGPVSARRHRLDGAGLTHVGGDRLVDALKARLTVLARAPPL
ncbi:hypothetical protein BU14_0463s0009 [Porphyra umbilicalis]|uniref:Uncharacterized protein n=1 Tax=Porphyra umbilicalis TaxID=2786 RepID=A0A1X6NU94_PORUM|nr:hypothetical protein BU14_0463s0009 [Porphyra umbilicalis]|eukprot:OSX72147.1 hypothetical protein BU14_0463s0009 [Porphyra umbilicalis]